MWPHGNNKHVGYANTNYNKEVFDGLSQGMFGVKQTRGKKGGSKKQKGGSIISGGSEARTKRQISWIKRKFGQNGGGYNYKNDKKTAGKTADKLVSWMSKI